MGLTGMLGVEVFFYMGLTDGWLACDCLDEADCRSDLAGSGSSGHIYLFRMRKVYEVSRIDTATEMRCLDCN